MGYVITRGGTFGTVERTYRNEAGEECAVIRWGRLGWVTPAYARDVKQLRSSYESEARAEANAWLDLHDAVPACVWCATGKRCT